MGEKPFIIFSISKECKQNTRSNINQLIINIYILIFFSTYSQRKCTCQRKKKRCYCFRPNRNENWLFSRYSTGWKCGLHADWTELTGIYVAFNAMWGSGTSFYPQKYFRSNNNITLFCIISILHRLCRPRTRQERRRNYQKKIFLHLVAKITHFTIPFRI